MVYHISQALPADVITTLSAHTTAPSAALVIGALLVCRALWKAIVR